VLSSTILYKVVQAQIPALGHTSGMGCGFHNCIASFYFIRSLFTCVRFGMYARTERVDTSTPSDLTTAFRPLNGRNSYYPHYPLLAGTHFRASLATNFPLARATSF
jgi:hypothetical protein